MPLKSLFVTSEVAGLAKAGGLGEVSAGLPLALRQRGIDVRVLMPAYHEVIAKVPSVNWFGDLPGRACIPAAWLGEVRLDNGMMPYLVASPTLFERRGTPYCTPEGADWQDNHLRFARCRWRRPISPRPRRARLDTRYRSRQRLAGRAHPRIHAMGRNHVPRS